VKFKNQNYPVLIAPTHIPELNTVEHTSDGIKLGASVTLTILEDVLNEACNSMPGTNVKFSCLTGEKAFNKDGSVRSRERNKIMIVEGEIRQTSNKS